MSKQSIAAILALAGVTLTPEDLVSKVPVDQQKSTVQMGQWEAQSLLVSLKWPYPELVPVNCWSCGEEFLTNYKANVYCSMRCCKTDLEKKGLVWNPKKDFFQQWGNLEPPLMIPPEAIKAMRRLLSLLDQGSPDQIHSPEPDYEPEPEQNFGGISRDLLVLDTEPEIQQELPPDQDDDFLDMLNAL